MSMKFKYILIFLHVDYSTQVSGGFLQTAQTWANTWANAGVVLL